MFCMENYELGFDPDDDGTQETAVQHLVPTFRVADDSVDIKSDNGSDCGPRTDLSLSRKPQVPISASSEQFSTASSLSDLHQKWREHSGSVESLSGGLAIQMSSRVTATTSTTTLPRDASQEILIAEIKRLRERLATLETDNTSMSLKLSQQQWEVDHRLAEIEMHICGSSSVGSMASNSDERSPANRESVI